MAVTSAFWLVAGTLTYPFKKATPAADATSDGTDHEAAADSQQRDGTGRLPTETVKPAATGKIEDFGQKLGGARKDRRTVRVAHR